jgi:hypothetical protein
MAMACSGSERMKSRGVGYREYSSCPELGIAAIKEGSVEDRQGVHRSILLFRNTGAIKQSQ